MASILEGIAQAIQTAAPLVKVEAGYALDVQEWVESNRVAKRALVLISHEGDEPEQPKEGGHVRRFFEEFAIYFRSGIVTAEDMNTKIRPQYLAIRSALNGLTVKDEDGRDRQVTIQPGRMERSGGFGVATLSLRVV